jgi:hypothetical protein
MGQDLFALISAAMVAVARIDRVHVPGQIVGRGEAQRAGS